ncbi:MAG: radical SAM family heme chaperone HemW [Neisseriaceae bacterium]
MQKCISLRRLPPLSLYLHYPWCLQKCPYCDFNSHALPANHQVNEDLQYLECLLLDLQQQLSLIENRCVQSIFFGGGTPSLVSPKALQIFFNRLQKLIELAPVVEITMEVNPGTVTEDKLKGYREAGVNRLSIGVQSLQDIQLQAIGRIHNHREALQAIEWAQSIFPVVNVDFMYGLPQQTSKSARQDLERIIQTGVVHISAYELTLEPHTWFFHHPPQLPTEKKLESIEQEVRQTLQAGGYHRYEISAFAKNDYFCQHNLNYWQFGDYLGVGAGAHGKITLPHQIVRTQRVKSPQAYLRAIKGQKIPATFLEEVSVQDLPTEFMLNALRLLEGFPLALYEERTGLSIQNLQPPLTEAIEKRLITVDNGHLKPTPKGIKFLNFLLELFFT